MRDKVLVDHILDKLPANYTITFTLLNQGGSMSKIKYYVNWNQVSHLYLT